MGAQRAIERAKTVPPPQIPLAFVAFALATLGATLAWLLIGGLQPLALLHALVLGVFLTIAMGLLYQFVPVVAGSPLRLSYLAYAHLAAALAGTLCVVSGFQRGDFTLVGIGGLAHLGGVGLQAVVLGTTVRGSKPPAPAAAAVLSLLWLLSTMLAGLWLAFRFAAGQSSVGFAGKHALLGLAGFFGTLIVAVSFRLLRMVERVDREERAPFLALGVSGAAVLTLFLGRVVGGYALLLVALTVVANVLAIARVRNPAYQRETLMYALASAAAAAGAAWAYASGRPYAAVVLAVWFFIGTAEVGYLQRIVPFIWWIRRSRAEGTRTIPTLANMNATSMGYAIAAFWILAGALWLTLPDARWAAAAASVAWLGLLAQLSRPFWLRRRA